MSIEHPKDKNLLLDFLDEMSFDVDYTCEKSTRDESLVKLNNSPAIRASSLKNLKTKKRFYKFLVFKS